MSEPTTMLNEEAAANAFDKQAARFDVLYGLDTIIRYKRKRVRDHVCALLSPGSKILELNAGTGEDAIYFAKQGYNVHATDVSAAMQEILERKIWDQNLEDRISNELCSFTKLDSLHNKGPYDFIFSNFAGLNCTNELEKVVKSFSSLLKPGGQITLVLLPRFCLWESLLLFKGKFRTAFRRFSGKKGTRARVEGQEFRCWYYNPSFIKNILKTEFEFVAQEGLCTLVAPSYMENFAEKHPRLYQFLLKNENRYKSKWPWRNIGDYYIISFRKK